ncbi:activator-dependent family glycosyltransferase [Streptomyces sp. SL13]|jgi:glycosyltransferase (activator-dependent family)|uniref:Activator-dependent family glycosyltransferase n=1 Tax=Streptantibioticus silvisoli TaxID=2705255 RepID=A0AA90GZS9_9ACTN|nr:activator-dependent family glycosyltransferase [Streptantibioticus silvisoli]MDI5963738.1 activator-dependent family glycosyltransferase [Streptantibioticus silvisoli]MDI5968701.1 activator-dependent family glycosyltransferase [Streptantibioticus silvisoli]
MRVLFAGLSESAHLYGMVPLAWALTSAGHEVLMANEPSLTDTITGAGLIAAPVGRDHGIHSDMSGSRESQDADVANWSRLAPGQVDWPAMRRRYEISVPWGFARYNDPVIDDMVELARSWRPDLVVRDPLAYAGAIAARACGAAHARLLWCADVYAQARRTFVELHAQQPPAERTDPLAEWIDERGAPFGVVCDEELLNGQFTLDTLPPKLRPHTGLRTVSMRYQPYNGPAVLWDWLRDAPKRPRVCLTLGRTNTEAYGGDYISVPDILTALSALDIEVVAALMPQQRAQLGELPENVRAVHGVALHTLLPSCSLVIHHGGWGTFSTALVNAVPQLTLSTYVADQEMRGRTLEREGAGVFLHHSEVTPEKVVHHTRRMLDDATFAVNAKRLSDESAAMPTPYETVAELERIAMSR